MGLSLVAPRAAQLDSCRARSRWTLRVRHAHARVCTHTCVLACAHAGWACLPLCHRSEERDTKMKQEPSAPGPKAGPSRDLLLFQAPWGQLGRAFMVAPPGVRKHHTFLRALLLFPHLAESGAAWPVSVGADATWNRRTGGHGPFRIRATVSHLEHTQLGNTSLSSRSLAASAQGRLGANRGAHL